MLFLKYCIRIGHLDLIGVLNHTLPYISDGIENIKWLSVIKQENNNHYCGEILHRHFKLIFKKEAWNEMCCVG